MYHVVEQVEKIALDNQLTEVATLVLQVGELSSVVPHYLQVCWPAAVDGTLLESTQLEIEMLSANGLCGSCGKVYALVQHQNTCPHCGGQSFEQLSGGEFFIKEIVAY